MKISNREIIIAAIAILVLLGIGYFINNNSKDNKKEETKQEDKVNLDDSGSTDENKDDQSKDEEEKEAQGVISTDPKSGAEVTLASAPKDVVIKFDKEIAGGSEITVVSDKNVDVVTAGNKITADLKQLSAPVSISVAGTYTVAYKINWKDGTKSDGSYKFTVK